MTTKANPANTLVAMGTARTINEAMTVRNTTNRW